MDDNIKNSEAYLNSFLEKENGFSVSKNYFETFEDAIEVKLLEDNFPKEQAFTPPHSYFKELENNILTKIKVSSIKKETKVISFKERVLKIIPVSVAASLILFIGLNSFVFNTDKKLTLDSLSETDIEYWLDDNVLNSNDIAAVLEEDILEENDFSYTVLQDDSIEDYINSIDNSYLLNELN